MTEGIRHVKEVMVVMVDRRGWLIGASFDLIDAARLALPINRFRIWHVSGATEITKPGSTVQAGVVGAS
jgi:hypothetical protein